MEKNKKIERNKMMTIIGFSVVLSILAFVVIILFGSSSKENEDTIDIVIYDTETQQQESDPQVIPEFNIEDVEPTSVEYSYYSNKASDWNLIDDLAIIKILKERGVPIAKVEERQIDLNGDGNPDMRHILYYFTKVKSQEEDIKYVVAYVDLDYDDICDWQLHDGTDRHGEAVLPLDGVVDYKKKLPQKG